MKKIMLVLTMTTFSFFVVSESTFVCINDIKNFDDYYIVTLRLSSTKSITIRKMDVYEYNNKYLHPLFGPEKVRIYNFFYLMLPDGSYELVLYNYPSSILIDYSNGEVKPHSLIQAYLDWSFYKEYYIGEKEIYIILPKKELDYDKKISKVSLFFSYNVKEDRCETCETEALLNDFSY
jgi:hypothetical protein